MAAAAVVACGTAAADTPGLKVIDPAELKREMEGLARELGLPGAMFLLSTPQGDVVFGYGTNELGKADPPRADTHFRAASNTKTMTAAVIVQMAEEGRLGLDDPVSAYVEGVPEGDRITLRMLLTMRSGLFNFTDAPELAASLDADPGKVWTAAEVLGMAFARPPAFAPGAAYAYNNTNYYLLGLVAEKVDGKPLAAVFRERLFRPLGMRDTALPAPGSVALPEPLAHGYIYGGPGYALVDAPYPAELVAAAKAGALAPEDATWQNPSAYFAAGGVISTADDLATWMEALVGGRALDAAFQKQWLESPEAPVPGEPAMQKYGFGILTLGWGSNTIYYHEGEMPGYQSFMGRDPVNDVTLVIWTNLTLDLDGAPTANTLMVKALDEIYAFSPLDAAR
ncbi:serine hydrolase [Amaricoccus sp.]|uniref:serine hydrolase domain-containing protein n=1 Tax=Amaricoccus sp. TaxID=1872485 RepID=UPI001B414B90|nr:serine hydrolase domain-containing protein [Amaricoccus sp.]MBP7003471.1 beta-lactamase family protein [Amaricoccus sp.]